MYYGGAEAWNLRDRHMFETLEQLLRAGGAASKAVVWAHNSHIGDARHTEMGSLARRTEHWATLQGTVWRRGRPHRLRHACRHRRLRVRLGWRNGSQEMSGPHSLTVPSVFVTTAAKLPSCSISTGTKQLADALAAQRPERFIGVIYRPETERFSHYMDACLSRQFDAFVWFDEYLGRHAAPCGWRHDGESSGHLPIRPLNASRHAMRHGRASPSEIEGWLASTSPAGDPRSSWRRRPDANRPEKACSRRNIGNR